jgi:hypothetical protein
LPPFKQSPAIFDYQIEIVIDGAHDARRSPHAQGCAIGEHTLREETRFLLVTFLDSGHPAVRGFAASFAVRAAPAAQCASKEK